MRITDIRLKHYRQFRSLHLPLRNPETGAPLEKVCFIGSNGTGKSTLLALIANFLKTGNATPHNSLEADEPFTWDSPDTLIGFSLQLSSGIVHVIGNSLIGVRYLSGNIVDPVWAKLWNPDRSFTDLLEDGDIKGLVNNSQLKSISLHAELTLEANSDDLAIYAPPDGVSLLPNNQLLPQTTLSEALGLFKNFPAFHDVSYANVKGFWNLLIYQIKKRESDFQQYLNDAKTQNKTVAEARKAFDIEHPEILEELAQQWNLILDRAGLEFDTENAKIPVQLNENLNAYVRLRRAKDVSLPYNVLSSGIRNLLFRLGHIYTLYFNRSIERGFLLIDELESSLFPDLLYDIVQRYLSIIQNTQFFVATHSPIVASQFAPFERVILEFNDDGYVSHRTGISPEGDDPNDLLVNDFVVRSLYGAKGIEKWRRFLELKRLIPETSDPASRNALLKEYAQIGNAYNFAPNEISH